jgi:hypothetical protein
MLGSFPSFLYNQSNQFLQGLTKTTQVLGNNNNNIDIFHVFGTNFKNGSPMV